MTSIIRLTPLSGGLPAISGVASVKSARDGHPEGSPHCYILEVDQFTFLLDCGWDPKFDMRFVNELKKHTSKIDAVLISYPDNMHLGALPYAVGKLGLNCPIYATVPVYKMGQMFMYDSYESRHSVEDFDLFTLDEVDKTFEMITQLKYNQTVYLKGKGEGIAITPLAAGHMIGGTIWKIVKDGEEEIIYAVDFNHKKEQHLNGCDVERVQRPSLLIIDAFNLSYRQLRRRQRDEMLITTILQTLRNNGNVMICVDTAGRVLELAHIIDHLWQMPDSGLLAYSLAFLNNVSYNVIEFAKSQIEWMSEKLMRSFEGQRNNPFAFRHLKLCHSMAEVNKVPSPKVVLASTPDMESGFSRELFLSWCGNAKNTIIVTSRTGEGTLSHDLVQNGTDRVMHLEVKRRVKLVGAELDEFRRKQREEEQASAAAARAKAATSVDDESSDDDMDVSGVDASGLGSGLGPGGASGLGSGHSQRHDIVVRQPSVTQTPEQHHKQSFFKSTKSRYPMFPFHEEKIRWDDYGELIKPEEWMDTSNDDKDRNYSNGPSGGSSKRLEGGLFAEENSDLSEVPTKCISSVQAVSVNAKIQFIDFEGRSDGESVYKMVQQLKPRRVIVVRGAEESCRDLADFCTRQIAADKDRKSLSKASDANNVFVARNGEVVDASTDTSIYQVRLPESLVSKLLFSKGKDGLLAWVDAVVNCKQDEIQDVSRDVEDNTQDGEDGQRKAKALPALEPLDLHPEVQKQDNHNFIFINELKLSDFKMVLTRSGIPSEFQGGVLFCGSKNNIALRRHDSGRIAIEGAACEDYFFVRDLLYEQYAII